MISFHPKINFGQDILLAYCNKFSFLRLVFDRESGKPKGYGFAEYQDQETALSAMRNLNSRELHGRTLRVDHATSEKNKIMVTTLYLTHAEGCQWNRLGIL